MASSPARDCSTPVRTLARRARVESTNHDAADLLRGGPLGQLGVKGFKAKGITPEQLRALIERAHLHGLTVTGHLDSGNRNSVNPRDAILMGIDRIEHFMGGDAFTPDSRRMRRTST